MRPGRSHLLSTPTRVLSLFHHVYWAASKTFDTLSLALFFEIILKVLKNIVRDNRWRLIQFANGVEIPFSKWLSAIKCNLVSWSYFKLMLWISIRRRIDQHRNYSLKMFIQKSIILSLWAPNVTFTVTVEIKCHSFKTNPSENEVHFLVFVKMGLALCRSLLNMESIILSRSLR